MNEIMNDRLSNFGERLNKLASNIELDLRNSTHRSKLAKELCLNTSYISIGERGTYAQKGKTIKEQITLREFCEIETKWILAYSQYFNCSIDYLAGIIEQPTYETTDIYSATGLSFKAIQGIQKLNQDDEIATANHNPKLCVMDTLNRLLSSQYINYLLLHIQNFLSPSYIVPVYHTKGKGKNTEKLVCSTSKTDETTNIITGQKTYIQHFATESDPNDNIPVFINSTFLHTVALKDIEKTLDNIANEVK